MRLIMNKKHPRHGQLTRGGMRKESVIERIELKGARDYIFNNEHGDQLSVWVQYCVSYQVCYPNINQCIQDYFNGLGRTLDFPTIICIRLRAQHGDVVVPLELYDVIPGQQYKSKLNAEATSQMIRFTQLKPEQRVRAIREGFQV